MCRPGLPPLPPGCEIKQRRAPPVARVDSPPPVPRREQPHQAPHHYCSILERERNITSKEEESYNSYLHTIANGLQMKVWPADHSVPNTVPTNRNKKAM
uniref:Uncharacterized protein n=1 Tax=Oryza punctata TaxID=4537 RepID=A0A0E0JPI1_ORYPU